VPPRAGQHEGGAAVVVHRVGVEALLHHQPHLACVAPCGRVADGRSGVGTSHCRCERTRQALMRVHGLCSQPISSCLLR
jgi:hypothetical protein